MSLFRQRLRTGTSSGTWAPASIHASRYHPEIDGLRALAIIAVVLFHARVPFMRAGFAGVDIFFAISGYLIIGMLAREYETKGRVDWPAFYVRRIRRLMPIFCVVILFALAASTAILFPFGEQQLADKSAFFAILLSSNVFFWHLKVGYFDPGIEQWPLLHTWSLSVEEQFYLSVPAVFLFVTRMKTKTQDRHNKLVFTFSALLLLSFGFAIWQTRASPSAAFYLLPSRVPEFSMGALAALFAGKPPGPKLRNPVSLLALATVVLSTLPYNYGGSLPLARVMISALATAALLWATSGPERTLAGRGLSLRPLRWIGERSYGWYMWHFPALALWRAYWLQDTSLASDLAVCSGALLLSHLTFLGIEQPARRSSIFLKWPPRRVFYASALALILMAAASGGLASYAKWVGRSQPDMRALETRMKDLGSNVEPCLIFGEPLNTDIPQECRSSAGRHETDIYVWGDSHASHLMPAFAGAASDFSAELMQATKAGCPPLYDYLSARQSERGRSGCKAFNAAMITHMIDSARHRRTAVVMAANWGGHIQQPSLNAEARVAMAMPQDITRAEAERRVKSTLIRTIANLTSNGVRVVLLAPVPEQRVDVPKCLFRFGEAVCRTLRSEAEKTRGGTIALLRDAAAQTGAHLVDPLDALCDADWCPGLMDGNALYFDSNHLSTFGARRLTSTFHAALSQALH